jgi:hypothetical protein
MDKAALVERLNLPISLELCAVIQYNHYASILSGADRRVWHELFENKPAYSFSWMPLTIAA